MGRVISSPPTCLCSSVLVAGANRIGHGVDVYWEANSTALIQHMAKHEVGRCACHAPVRLQDLVQIGSGSDLDWITRGSQEGLPVSEKEWGRDDSVHLETFSLLGQLSPH